MENRQCGHHPRRHLRHCLHLECGNDAETAKESLLTNAEKIIDASFTNVNTGIGVRLDNVTWLGAKSVQNVIKIGADFGAYGRHMEFIADGEMPVTITGISSYGGQDPVPGFVFSAENILLDGTNLAYKPGDIVTATNGTKTWTFSGNAIRAVGSTQLDLDYSQAVDESGETGFDVVPFTFQTAGASTSPRGGCSAASARRTGSRRRATGGSR